MLNSIVGRCRASVPLALALGGLLVSPVHAQSQTLNPAQSQARSSEALACPVAALTPQLRSVIASGLAGELESDAVEDIVAATQECVIEHGVSEQDAFAYGEYAAAAVAIDVSGRALTSAGFDLAAVHRVFDVGPGAANSGVVEFNEDVIVQLIAQGLPQDVDLEAIPQSTWAMLGVYVEAAEVYFPYLAGQ